MGGIDLDRASDDEAQKIVQAKEYFTEETDGLKQEWKGRILLNPPYSYPLIGAFIKKLCDELFAGNVEAALRARNIDTERQVNLHATNGSTPFNPATSFTPATMADGRDCQPTQGQCFFYFGTGIFRVSPQSFQSMD